MTLRVRATKLQRHRYPYAHFAPRNMASRRDDSSQESLKGLEIQRLFEMPCRAQLLAVFLGLRAGLPAHNNYRNRLRPAERGERLAEFVAGILRHAQIEQDGVGPVLQRESQTCFRFTCVNDFVGVAEFEVHQPPKRLIVIHHQQLSHRSTPPITANGRRAAPGLPLFSTRPKASLPRPGLPVPY